MSEFMEPLEVSAYRVSKDINISNMTISEKGHKDANRKICPGEQRQNKIRICDSGTGALAPGHSRQAKDSLTSSW